jgi:hypothetical protein
MSRIACSLALFLFAVSNIALAANWVVSRNLDNGAGTFYIDADSVSRDGDRLIYWSRVVYSTPMNSGVGTPRTAASPTATRRKQVKEEICRIEVNLGSRQVRTLEFFRYDPNHHELDHDSDPGHWKQYGKDDGTEVDNASALKYAKQGNEHASQPTP